MTTSKQNPIVRRVAAIAIPVAMAALLFFAAACDLPEFEETEEELTPPSPEMLQESIAELEARIERVEQQIAANFAEQIGVAEEEVEQYLSRWRELRANYERRLGVVTQLEPLQADYDELTEADIAAAEALPDPPPYTLSYVDGLRDMVASRQLEHDADVLELQQAREELERFQARVGQAHLAVNEAQQTLEANTDPVLEPRLEWRLSKARLNLRAAQEAVTTQEWAVRLAELNAGVSEARLQQAQRHVYLALQQARFPVSDLEERLQAIERERFEAESELAEARSELAAEEARLVTAREALSEARDEEVIYERRAVLEAREAAVNTARRRGALLEERLEYRDIEVHFWQTRFDLVNRPQTAGLRAMETGVSQRLDRLRHFRTAVETRAEGLRTQIAAFEQRIAETDPANGALPHLQETVQALQQRLELNYANLNQLRSLEQLGQRVNTEIAAAIQAEPDLLTLRDYWATATDTVRDWWNQVIIGDPAGEFALTVRQVVTAIIILIVGFLVSQRLSRFVRYVILRRAEVDANVAATVEKILYYLLIVIIVLYAMYSVNIPLTVFTIFGGAIAIGVGFGAQNIINNFISGIILMAEQPIRINDYVEVDGELGQVVNIGARCSHIRAFNGTEILIPNSAFLEKKVINWTLSDSQLRFDVKVGVPHGTSAREVSRLMLRAVQDHGQVLDDPPPVVLLQEFGESALIFQVFFWLEMTDRNDVRVICSDVRFRIARLFRDAGIRLAYPQRDLHLDSSRPLDVRMVTGGETDYSGDTDTPNLPD